MVEFKVSDVVRTKVLRLFYFMSAGGVCAVAINKWKELERRSVINEQKQLKGQSLETSSNVITESAE